jgi:alpha-ketoglutarate-dependent taurine dioxygenase
MNNPFDLAQDGAYRAWRDRKLRDYPPRLDDLRVELSNPAAPSAAELERIAESVRRANLAVFACEHPDALDKDGLLRLGRGLGLVRLDNNPCADERAVSTLRVHSAGKKRGYIPYTNRPLSWHTDGYYNLAGRQVRAWMLYCVHNAAEGGENALLDHEIAYIRLRDQDPELVRALMHPGAMTIPANVADGDELREASTGPVFSVRDGHLHMRYSARARNIAWRKSAKTQEARDALTRLFSSDDGYIFRHKLAPGEGYVSNNVLHNRTSFSIAEDGGPDRTLLRTRYLDRVAVAHGRGPAVVGAYSGTRSA